MPFQIIRNDITKMSCDAIVNAAKSSLLGGGGVDGAIHRAAGPALLSECRTLGGCEPGQAKLTRGYRLPARYVIHTVGPVYRDGRHGEREILASCYRSSLLLAAEYGCETVAFPLISAGVFGYPKAEAIRVAADVITEFLLDHDMTVYLVLYNKTAFTISQKLYTDIRSYIDDVYVDERRDRRRASMARRREALTEVYGDLTAEYAFRDPDASPPCGAEETAIFGDIEEAALSSPTIQPAAAPAPSLAEALRQKDESFSQALLRAIDERGMTDAACYKKANIDRKLFSKIRNDVGYKPSKPTALAFAIALELSLEETKALLEKAGYALSHASEFDIIIEYFIQRRNYDIFEINEALFAFDQNLLGA